MLFTSSQAALEGEMREVDLQVPVTRHRAPLYSAICAVQCYLRDLVYTIHRPVITDGVGCPSLDKVNNRLRIMSCDTTSTCAQERWDSPLVLGPSRSRVFLKA